MGQSGLIIGQTSLSLTLHEIHIQKKRKAQKPKTN
jgi:hypothetical protein